MYDITDTSVRIDEELKGSFYFTAPGPAVLCYRFSFNETYRVNGEVRRSPYMLMPGIKAAVIRFDSYGAPEWNHFAMMPKGTALNCSSILTVQGAGFDSLKFLEWDLLSAHAIGAAAAVNARQLYRTKLHDWSGRLAASQLHEYDRRQIIPAAVGPGRCGAWCDDTCPLRV